MFYNILFSIQIFKNHYDFKIVTKFTKFKHEN